jgi:hypothetical protein
MQPFRKLHNMRFVYIEKNFVFHRFQQPAARFPQPRPNVKPVNQINPRAKRVPDNKQKQPDNKQKQPDNKLVKNAVRYLIIF